MLDDYGEIRRIKEVITDHGTQFFANKMDKNGSRKLFDDFDKFLNWYNSIRYHESLDEKHYLQTPEDAFWSRMPDGCKLNQFLLRMERDFNAKG